MTAPSVKEAFEAIPFDDDADQVKTWKGLALSAISDMRRYADDDLPRRRMVSVDAYEADAVRLAIPQAPAPSAARERIARIIDPDAYVALDELAKEGDETSDSVRRYLRGVYDPHVNAALAKADAILALLTDAAAIRAAHIEVLRGLVYSCADQVNLTGPDKTTGSHLIDLIDIIERTTDMPIDKIARWTGFIQGVLAARGLLNVDDERNRTRPIFAAAIRAADDSSDKWQHRKRGTTYTIIGQALAQCEKPITDNETVLVYRDVDSGKWAIRRPDEFHDGRFERVEK